MTSIHKIGLNVWAKLESESVTGTHKDRSMKPWIESYVNQGIKDFVISSSGNSARAALKICEELGCSLKVFLGSTAKKDAFRYAKEHNIPNLRASIDDRALIGYRQIAYELVSQIKVDNIFIPTSSGATLLGMYLGFKNKISSFYVVQTSKVYPMASYFDKDFIKEKGSKAKSIVDNIAHRKDSVIKVCEETNGGGFVISNKELEESKLFLKKGGYQSALAYAGFIKWKKQNNQGTSLCLFTD